MKQIFVLRTFSCILIAILLALSLTSLTAQPASAASITPACTAYGLVTAVNNAQNNDTIDYTADCEIALGGQITFLARNVTINGNGHRVVLHAASNSRLFYVPLGATVTLKGLTLMGGSVSNVYGGAIYNLGTLTIVNSTLTGNRATGIGMGGAISSSGSLTVQNSTFFQNTSGQNGSAVYVDAGSAALTHVTIASNTAGTGYNGAVYRSSGTLTLQNSVLASNTNSNCGGAITNGNGNVSYPFTDTSCGSTGYTTGDPNLAASLAYNSGSTQTLAITGPPSSAVDLGAANCLPRDQRGAARSGAANTCDSGAYEYNGAGIATTTVLASTTANPSVYGTQVALTATVFPIPASGTVNFAEGTTAFGSVVVDASTGVAAMTTAARDLSAGAHTITATFAPGDTVSATSSGTLARNTTARAVTVTPISGQSKVYGNADPAFTYSATPALVTGDSFTGALSRASGEIVGSYAITQGSLNNSNYAITFTNGMNFAITARPVTIVPDANQSKIYGDLDPTLAFTLSSGTLAEDDSFTGALSRATGENVGEYAISQGNLALNSNYTLTFTPGVIFTITVQPVTVVPDSNQFKVYGDADPVLTYHLSSGRLVGSDKFTGALVRAEGKDVGSYAITQGSLALSSNYTLTFTPGVTFAITARPITVTPISDQFKAYGDADPALAYLLTGMLATGDSFTGALSRATGENVGDYAITQGSLRLSSNYIITFTPGVTFTITVRSVTVTANAQTRVYGDADPALTYTVTSGSLVKGDKFIGALSRVAGENAGDYAINLGSLALSSNYNLTYEGANLSITPAILTFTADNKSRMYGADNPPLTYTVTGFKNGDTESGLGGKPALSTTATIDSRGGSYPITIAIGAMHNANYDFHFVNGTLSILEFQVFIPFVGLKP